MLRAVWQPTESNDPRREMPPPGRTGWGLELLSSRDARDETAARQRFSRHAADRGRERRVLSARLAGRLGDWSPRRKGLELR